MKDKPCYSRITQTTAVAANGPYKCGNGSIPGSPSSQRTSPSSAGSKCSTTSPVAPAKCFCNTNGNCTGVHRCQNPSGSTGPRFSASQPSAVVTEQGTAELWGRSDREQAEALVREAAHPDAREELREEGVALGLLD